MRFSLIQQKTFIWLTVCGVLLVAGIYFTAGIVFAAPNLEINYQGKLTNSSNVAVPNGGYQIEFSLYTASSGGSAIWTETRTGANEVTIQNGLFSVMLGSVTPLTGVDFNQPLYLGITIEADSEMTPRKVLGTVPAAFEAINANTVGGVASTSLLRNDQIGSISATSASAMLTVTQNGTGDILNLFDGGTEVFSVLDGGNVGIGSTSPSSRLTVAGNTFIGGNLTTTGTLAISGTSTLATTTATNLTLAQALAATSGGTGLNTITQNQLLIGGPGNTWTQIATSSLGFASAFSNSAQLAALLSDETGSAGGGLAVFSNAPTFTGTTIFANSSTTNATTTNATTTTFAISGLTSGRVPFITTGGRLTDDTNFTYNGTNLGLGVSQGIAIGGVRVFYANTTNDSVVIGENAGATFTATTLFNNAIGWEAGRYASSSNTNFNNYFGFQAGALNTGAVNNIIGYQAAGQNTGSNNNLIGNTVGNNNSGNYNNFLGHNAGYNNTGSYNNSIGFLSGYNNTGSYNNFLGYFAGYANGGSYNEMIGYNAGQYLNATSTIAIGSESFYGNNGGSGQARFTALNNTAIGYRAGYNATNTADNNILIGYQAADNLTTGNNNIIIGYDIDNITATTDNALNIGNLIFGTGINGTGTTTSTGNIGIGSSSPSSRLTVAGSGYFGGNLVATGTLAISGTSTLATTTATNLTLAQALAATSGGTGLSTITQNQLLIGGPGNTWTQIATSSLGFASAFTNSAQLAALLSDETGSASGGLAVFSNAPTFTGTTIFANSSTTNATTTNATTTTFAISGLTSGRVPFITTGGRLTDDSNFTYNGTNLVLGGTTGITLGGDVAINRGAANRLDIASGDSLNLVLGSIAFNGTTTITASTTNRSYTFGELAGETFSSITTDNVAIGFEAGRFASTSNADYNYYIGTRAGYRNTGNGNNFFGERSGEKNTGSENNMFGEGAGNQNTGSYNNIFGYYAGQNNTGSYNDTIGAYLTGYNNTGSFNNIIGYVAGGSNTGSYSTFIGSETAGLMSASNSVAIGAYALRGGSAFILGSNAATTTNNTVIGYGAGYNVLTGGNNNILLGYQAADSLTTGANNIVIGYDVEAPSNSGSNQLNIGNLIFGTGINGTGTTTSTGNIGIGSSTPSSRLTVAGSGYFGGNLVATGTLAISGTSTLATTSVTSLSVGSLSGLLFGTNGAVTAVATSSLGLSAAFANSAQLAALLSDESGTGSVAFTNSPTFVTPNLGTPTTLVGTNITGTASGLTAGTVTTNANLTGMITSVGNAASLGSFTSANLLTALTDETGTGTAVFSISPTFTGTANFASTSNSGRLTVSGTSTLATTTVTDFTLAGAFRDALSATGTLGMVLQTTGTSTRWVATSSLGFLAAGGAVTSIGPAGQLQAGPTITLASSTGSFNGLTLGTTITGAGNTITYTPSITGTLTNAGLATPWLSFATTSTGSDLSFSSASSTLGGTVTLNIPNSSATARGLLTGSDWITFNGKISSTSLDTIAELDALITDVTGVTGTGSFVLSASPTFTGTANFASTSNSGRLTVSGTSTLATTSATALSANTLSVGSLSGLLFGTAGNISAIATSTLGIALSDTTGTLSATRGGTGLTSYATGDLIYASGANTLANRTIGTTGQVLQVVGGLPTWVATSSLGFGNGSLFTDAGATTYLTSLTDNLSVGTTSSLGLFTVATSSSNAAVAIRQDGTGNLLNVFDGATNIFTILDGGNVGIGTSSPVARLDVEGTGGVGSLYSAAAIFSNRTGQKDFVEIGSKDDVSYISAGARNSRGSVTNLVFSVATTTGYEKVNEVMRLTSTGNVGIGTSSPQARLSIQKTGVTGAQTAGIEKYFSIANNTLNALIYGENTYIDASSTATTTLVGNILRIADNSTLGNNVQGLQVQTNRGSNTQGENTAIAGFGRTFGVRGTTEGDAGALFEPAGVFAETRGTTQGNALRAFSDDITTANLVSFAQDTSAFSGTGLQMDFGTGGSFTGNFLKLRNAGTDRLTIDSTGALFSSSTLSILGTTTLATTTLSSTTIARLAVTGLSSFTGTSTLATSTISRLFVSGAFLDSTSNAGTNGMVLLSTGTSTQWVATSTLGISGGGSLFTDGGATTYLTSLTDNLAVGTTTASDRLNVWGNFRVGTGTTPALLVNTATGNLSLSTATNTARFTIQSNGTDRIQEWYQPNGSLAGSIASDGVIRVNQGQGDTVATTIERLRWAIGLGFTVRESSTAGFISASNNLVLTGGGADYVTAIEQASSTVAIPVQVASRSGLVIRGASSQTADLQQWQNSSGTSLAVVNSSGNFGIGTSTPSDRLTVAGGGVVANRPSNPSFTGTYNTSGVAYDVTVAGRYAYVADDTSGLQIIDISNPATPTLIGTFDTSGTASGVTVAGRYAYVADDASGLQIIDISNPAAPTLIGTFNTSGTANGITIAGRYAYVADFGSGLQIIDISNPAAPTLIGTFNTSGFSNDVTVAGRYAYVADDTSGLQIIDISNPSAPTLVGTYNTSGSAQGVTVAGRYAYVADDASGLQVIDISSSTNPTLTGTFDTSGVAYDVTIAGRYAYVADQNSGLQIIDISNPASSTLIGTFDTSGSARGVIIAGRYAYVADFSSGLQIIDINGSEFSSLFAGAVGATQANIVNDLLVGTNATVNGGLNVGSDADIRGVLTITGTASSSLFNNNANTALFVGSGNVGIGATSSAKLTVAGSFLATGTSTLATTSISRLALAGAFLDSTSNAGTNGMVLLSNGTSTQWVATSTLGLVGSSFTNSSQLAALLSDETGSAGGGLAVFSNAPTFTGTTIFANSSTINATTTNATTTTFAISGLTSGRVPFITAGGRLIDNANFTYNGTNLVLGGTTGITLGGDVAINRGAANRLDLGSGNSFNLKTGGAIMFDDVGYITATGTNNLLVGYRAGEVVGGFGNNFFGSWTGYQSVGNVNYFLGEHVGYNNTGNFNYFIGDYTGYDNTGAGNFFFGAYTGSNNSGNYNHFFGDYTGQNNVGTENLFLGNFAGANNFGDNNLFIGNNAASTPTSGSNNVVIGLGIDIPNASSSNQLNIGNLIFGTDLDGAGTTISTGNIGIGTSTPSDRLTVAGGGVVANRPSNPTLVGTFDTSGSAVSVTIVGRYAYVADAASGLQIIDISNPSAPTLTGTFNTTGSAGGVTIAGRYAYVGDDTSGLQIIDISNPTNPTLIGTYNTSGNAGSVSVVGRYAYVADLGSGLQIIDISNPTNPTLIGTYNTSGFAYAVTIAGRYAYVADGASGLQIIDISSSTNPTLTGTFDTSGGANGVTVAGRYAYVADAASGLQIIDISSSTNPTLTSTYNTSGNASAVTIAGRYAYVADDTTGLQIIDIASSTNPTLTGTFDTSGFAFGVTVAGRYAYVADFAFGGLQIIDINGSEFSSLFAGAVGATQANIVNDLLVGTNATVNGGLNVGSDADIRGTLTITGTASSSLYASNTNPALLVMSGRVGIGTSSPLAKLHVSIGNLVDRVWTPVNTTGLLIEGATDAVLNIAAASTSLSQIRFSDGQAEGVGNITYNHTTNRIGFAAGGNTNLLVIDGNGNVGVGTTTANAKLQVTGTAGSGDIFALASSSNARLLTVTSAGNVGIGTSSPLAKLNIGVSGFATAGTAGVDAFYQLANTASGTVQFGESRFLRNNSTATTTIVGAMYRLEDSTTLGNVLRGFEVQANRGTNTQGENTALSGFARTFGVRGFSSGDAGALFEPAGGFFETGGTTQGNAIRGYSSTITSSELLSLFQDSSAFNGTGLLMNFGNGSGSFSATTSRFIDLQNAGTSKFTVTAQGTTTIGDGTTNNQAGLQIGFGGLCVDNDGSCNASTTGRISSVSTYTGNSDLAEMYFSYETLLPGELVAGDGFISITRATADNKDRLLGVVSTKPGLLMGADDTPLGGSQTGYPLALKGRVPVILSDENGPIAVGDSLTISSIPGVAMKANGTDVVVGQALEAFSGDRKYTEGFINQFGDDVAAPRVKARIKNQEAADKGNCYYGGGSVAGASAPCKNKGSQTTSSSAQADEYAQMQAELAAMRNLPAESRNVDGREVQVGTVVMFVGTGYQIAAEHMDILNELTSTSSDLLLGNAVDENDTLWTRIKTLAQNFVDGVLTVTGIKTEKVETDKLCLGSTCVTEAQLIKLLENGGEKPAANDDTNDEDDNQNDNEGGDGSGEDTNEDTPPTGGGEVTPPVDNGGEASGGSGGESTPEPETAPEPEVETTTNPEPESTPSPEPTPEPAA